MLEHTAQIVTAFNGPQFSTREGCEEHERALIDLAVHAYLCAVERTPKWKRMMRPRLVEICCRLLGHGRLP